jgi:hypothetical protein
LEFSRESVLPFALTSAFYKALTVAGLVTAAGGLQAWGRGFVMGLVVVAGLGAFVGNVMVQIYRWAIYYNGDITGTFDPQLVFVYAAMSLAIFILLGKKFSGNQRILYHPAFARIGILVALICLPLAFWLKPKGFGEPIQDQLRRRIESRVDSLLNKLMEKGVISKKEVDELR